MPIYVYEVVTAAGESGPTFEHAQRITERPLTHHPETGEPVQRVIQAPFVGGTWTESSMHNRMKDDKHLGELGFTKYVKSGDGVYEKRCGKGPRTITRDNPIQASDL